METKSTVLFEECLLRRRSARSRFRNETCLGAADARIPGDLRGSPSRKRARNTRYTCSPAGMPRVMTVVGPIEFVILQTITYIHFESNMPRRIYTDGRDWPKDEEPSLDGYSIG